MLDNKLKELFNKIDVVTYKNDEFELEFKNLGNEGYEPNYKNNFGDHVRLDFMLEYFLSKKLEITRTLKTGDLYDLDKVKLFALNFIKNYGNKSNGSLDLNFEDYKKWNTVENAKRIMQLLKE